MRAKQRNLSQKHQGHSMHVEYDSAKSDLTRNRTHLYFQECHAKEALSRVEQDHPKLFFHDFEGIAGWQPYHADRAMLFQREIKLHQKRPLCKLQPINTKIMEKSSTKDTISYLKHMLCLLRSSRENHLKDNVTLKQINNVSIDVSVKIKQKQIAKKHVKNHKNGGFNTGAQKQNNYNDAQIINQLKNGLTKLPCVNSSKKSTINIRARKGLRFTLDKLLV